MYGKWLYDEPTQPLFVFLRNFTREGKPVFMPRGVLPPAEAMLEVRQQQQLLIELSGRRDIRGVDRSKLSMPQPHSERVEMVNL